MARQNRILSIDGGGIRGLIPALVLQHIEERTGTPVARLFDVIAGTSTGGILALGLACPDDSGAPRYAAADLARMYTDNGARIFPHDFLARARQLVEAKYPEKGREAVLTERLRDARLKDAVTEVIVTAYDIERREPMFFRTALARTEPDDHDFFMRDVARATSAAPTYFPPVRLKAAPADPGFVLVDGGVFANNPGMCAFVDRTTVMGTTENTLMVSLGTGESTRPFPFEQARSWGLIGWGRRIVDVVFDGVSDAVDYQLKTILGDHYHRLQIPLDKAKDEMDDASSQNLSDLRLEADELITTHAEELERVCQKLLAG